jgi:hypothetical protein
MSAWQVRTMIKIVRATYLRDYLLSLEFSNGAQGDYDLAPLIAKDTEMVRPLRDPGYFQSFFLELGALCWKNGFELSPEAIYRRLKETGYLILRDQVA